MKSLFLGLGIVLSLTSAQADDRISQGGGQGTLRVSEVMVDDLDGNMSQCLFRVNIVEMTSDYACSQRDQVLGSCESAIETATYVDEACSLKVGDLILTTTDQYTSGSDLRSPGLFTWVELNAGYSSLIMFPNYGK